MTSSNSQDMGAVKGARRTSYALSAALRRDDLTDDERVELTRMRAEAAAGLHAELRRVAEEDRDR